MQYFNVNAENKKCDQGSFKTSVKSVKITHIYCPAENLSLVAAIIYSRFPSLCFKCGHSWLLQFPSVDAGLSRSWTYPSFASVFHLPALTGFTRSLKVWGKWDTLFKALKVCENWVGSVKVCEFCGLVLGKNCQLIRQKLHFPRLNSCLKTFFVVNHCEITKNALPISFDR